MFLEPQFPHLSNGDNNCLDSCKHLMTAHQLSGGPGARPTETSCYDRCCYYQSCDDCCLGTGSQTGKIEHP